MARQCHACRRNLADFHHADPTLAKYLTSWAKLKSARENRLCARHQRSLTRAVKRARYLALLPYVNR